MEIYSSKPKDATAVRGTPMDEVRYGAMQVHAEHGFLSFFVRAAVVLNAGSLVTIWALFRLMNLFPPHDKPFMSAIGWYFFIGALCGVVAFFAFSYAKFIELQAIVRALTHNRRYEWHAKYETAGMSEEDLRKMPETRAPAPGAPPGAVGAGAQYFRMTGFLIFGAVAIWVLGANGFVSDLM